MKLLFDHNLSPRLVASVADLYPDSIHMRDVNLSTADDATVWAYAARYGLTIVSKDADFHQLSFAVGTPPKVIWIQRGNCSTGHVETLLRAHHHDLTAFAQDQEATFLALG